MRVDVAIFPDFPVILDKPFTRGYTFHDIPEKCIGNLVNNVTSLKYVSEIPLDSHARVTWSKYCITMVYQIILPFSFLIRGQFI